MDIGKYCKSRVIVFLENQYTARHGVLSFHQGLMACPDTEKPLPYRAGYSEKKTETITKDPITKSSYPDPSQGYKGSMIFVLVS